MVVGRVIVRATECHGFASAPLGNHGCRFARENVGKRKAAVLRSENGPGAVIGTVEGVQSKLRRCLDSILQDLRPSDMITAGTVVALRSGLSPRGLAAANHACRRFLSGCSGRQRGGGDLLNGIGLWATGRALMMPA